MGSYQSQTWFRTRNYEYFFLLTITTHPISTFIIFVSKITNKEYDQSLYATFGEEFVKIGNKKKELKGI